MSRIVVAADFGGTHLRAALVTAEGSVLGRRDVRTPTAEVPPEKTIAGVAGLLLAVAQGSPDPPVAACIAKVRRALGLLAFEHPNGRERVCR